MASPRRTRKTRDQVLKEVEGEVRKQLAGAMPSDIPMKTDEQQQEDRPPDPGNARAGMSAPEVEAYVRQYFGSRNVKPSEEAVHYWVEKYFSKEFAGDIGYWQKRLSEADEFKYLGQGDNKVDPEKIVDYCARIARVAVDWAIGIADKNPRPPKGGPKGENKQQGDKGAAQADLDARFKKEFPT